MRGWSDTDNSKILFGDFSSMKMENLFVIIKKYAGIFNEHFC